MRKFLAVVKREYLKLVWSKAFIIGTLIAPIMGLGFMVVPALIFSIEGEAMRVGVVDLSGKLVEEIKAELSPERQRQKEAERTIKDAKKLATGFDQTQEEKIRQATEQMKALFVVEEIKTENKELEQIKRELNARLRENALDAYLIIPPDFENQKFEFYARNTSDFIGQARFEDALNETVRRVRMKQSNTITQEKLDELNRSINFNAVRVSESGEAEDSGESFWLVFVVGFMIYLTLAIYGQTILGAVVEEKETRISEILFSSARPFTLMMGKLVGVSLVALTQLGIWFLSAGVILGYGLAQLAAIGMSLSFPNINAGFVLMLFVFFLLGYFTYATIYALIGSMVTTVQEGGQLALLPVLIMLGGFYCMFPVIRNPDSDFAFWTSVVPFVSPMVMPMRMAIQMPPFWLIALAILLSLATIFGLTWVAARAYRIGMLMYGKKATIPEVWRWIMQQ